MMLYVRLVYEFMKTGLFAIGGGLATLPFLHEISQETGWFTNQDISNMIAVSESTPGPIGINMSTYVGYITGGILGGILATLALVVPSIIIIEFISTILSKFKESKTIKYIFYGIRPASTALILVASISVFRSGLMTEAGDEFEYIPVMMFILFFVCMRKFKLHPLIYIGIAAVLGIFFQL